MKLRAVLTDLDGTLLEPDGSVCREAAEVLRQLRERRVPVLPVTSKTAAELEHLLVELELAGPAGFENGAGVVDRGGGITLTDAAVPVAELRRSADELRRSTAAPLRTLEELSDRELTALVGVAGERLSRMRQRQATLPLVVGDSWDATLRRFAMDRLRLVRGNRFLHLQGRHAKADVVSRLLATVPAGGAVVALGDSPNDLELLRHGDRAVIVPSTRGPDMGLRAELPGAEIAPAPHGRGWAKVMRRVLVETGA